jgi:hypothetical protein
VIDAEVALLLATEDAQRRRNGPPARGQGGPGQEPQDVRPGRAGEQIRKRGKPRQEERWQRRAAGVGQGVSHPGRRIGRRRCGNALRLRPTESASTLSRTAPLGHSGCHDRVRSLPCRDRHPVRGVRRASRPWRLHVAPSPQPRPRGPSASDPRQRSLRASTGRPSAAAGAPSETSAASSSPSSALTRSSTPNQSSTCKRAEPRSICGRGRAHLNPQNGQSRA